MQEIPIYIGDSIESGDIVYVVRRRSVSRVLYEWWWYVYGYRRFRPQQR